MLASAFGIRALLSVFALAALGLLGAAGLRCSAKPAQHKTAAHEPRLAPVPVGPTTLAVRAVNTGQNRLLLDEVTKERLRSSARRRSATWLALSSMCEELVGSPVRAGYEAFNWANAVASLSLCWHTTSDDRYAAGAIGYLQALLDDRDRVGDGLGGERIVQRDNGYGIRTFGAYSALGYDWLRDAPQMTPELKRKTAERLTAWLGWYSEKGYLRENPIANYFWGYLTALTFAGFALHDETPEAKAWLDRSRALLSERVLPAFKVKMAGGHWPEGSQYGEYTTAEIALVALAYRTAAGTDLTRELPYLGDTVVHHTHALLPDRKTVYDGGTWTARPAKPSSLAMSAVAWVLDGKNDVRARQARWLARNALPPIPRDQTWLAFLSERLDAPDEDPRRPDQTSFHAAGSGLTFARSDWSANAVWTSFQAGPRLAEDHQHKDQGHFELWRGSDALLVDGGGPDGGATINHNTLLVDDGNGSRCMTYTPNQGLFFANRVRTTRFADDGEVLAAVGDIGEAYAPSCAREGCEQRAVRKLIRSFVYVRPSLVVVHDAIEVEEASDRTVWAAHTTTEPTAARSTVSAIVGDSRVDIQTVLPEGARIEVLKEPNGTGDGPHRRNQPWGPMWRVEVDAGTAKKERSFLQYITVDAASAKPSPAERIVGKGIEGVRGTASGKPLAVLFVREASGGEARLGRGVRGAVVLGLEPGKRYTHEVSGDCALKIRRSDSGGVAASAGGLIKLSLPQCEA